MTFSKTTVCTFLAAITIAIPLVAFATSTTFFEGNGSADSTESCTSATRKTGYKEVAYPSENFDPEKVNDVQGVVLHHTAEPTAQRSLEVLTSKERGVSTHVVIDYDGTRYIMVPPTTVAWHAGPSLHAGRERCNEWMLGIEFQGDTTQEPLTQDQIDSAIEWLLPLIAEYHIPIDNIVTHQMIRTAYKKKHPESRAYNKQDITQTEYKRFMEQLRSALEQ